jgi:hypothetical protein
MGRGVQTGQGKILSSATHHHPMRTTALTLLLALSTGPLAAQGSPRARDARLARSWVTASGDTAALNALVRSTERDGGLETLGALAYLLKDRYRPTIIRAYAATMVGVYLNPHMRRGLVEGLLQGDFPQRPSLSASTHPDYRLTVLLPPATRDSIVAILRARAEDVTEDSTVRGVTLSVAFSDLLGERWSLPRQRTCRQIAARTRDSLPSSWDVANCPKSSREAIARAWDRPSTGEELTALLYASQVVRDDSLVRVYTRAAVRESATREMRMAALVALATQADPRLYNLRTEYFITTVTRDWRCRGWWGFGSHSAVFIDGPELARFEGPDSPRARLREVAANAQDPLVKRAASFLGGCITQYPRTREGFGPLGDPPPWETPAFQASVRAMELGAPASDGSAVELLGINVVGRVWLGDVPWLMSPWPAFLRPVEGLPAPEAILAVWMAGDTLRAMVRSMGAEQGLRPSGSYNSGHPAVLLPTPPLDGPSAVEVELGGPPVPRRRLGLPAATATRLHHGPRSGEGIGRPGQMIVVTGEKPVCEVLVAVGTDGLNWEAVPFGEFENGTGRVRFRGLRGRDHRMWVYRIAWPQPRCGSAG